MQREIASSVTKGLIETLPKRGYRLSVGSDAEHRNAPTVNAVRQADTHYKILLRATRIAAPVAIGAMLALLALLILRLTPARHPLKPPTLVVLPFADITDKQNNQLLADGITEDLINRLAQQPGLRVIARTSAFWFKGKDSDIATVAERLQASHVLEGSVRVVGERLRVNAHLVETKRSTHLWSRTFERSMSDDALALQSDIAESIATSIAPALSEAYSSSQAKRAGNPRPIKSHQLEATPTPHPTKAAVRHEG